MGPVFLTISLTLTNFDLNLNPNKRLRLTHFPVILALVNVLYPDRFSVSMVPENCRKAGFKIYQGALR